jgi:hypothetical protein
MDGPYKNITRRDAIKGVVSASASAMAMGGASFLVSERAAADDAADEEYDFVMARVKFECNQSVVDKWSITPGGERNLLEEFSDVVRCKVNLAPDCYCANPYYGDERHFNAVVDFTDYEKLSKYPFVFMTSEGHFSLSRKKEQNLKRYLEEGGFIFLDDCIYMVTTDYFYQSAYKMLENMFGRGSVKPIPMSHELFSNVYDLTDIGLPHVSGTYHPAQGVFIGDRLAAVLSSTDIHCGWTDRTGEWYDKPDATPHKYKEAIQFGINMIMYCVSH